MSGKQSAVLGSEELKTLRKRIDQLEKSLFCPHFWNPIVKKEFGVEKNVLKCIHCGWIRTELIMKDRIEENWLRKDMVASDEFNVAIHGKTADNCIFSSYKRILVASNGKRLMTSSKRKYCVCIEREDLHDYQFYLCKTEPENCPFWKADERWVSNAPKV